MIRRALALTLIVASTAAAQSVAQRDSIRDDRRFSFYDHGPYRAAVPRPEALLGYELGDQNTQFAQQERVLLAIAAAAPDRVKVEEIGTTNERRTMRLFIISSPRNIQRLDAIRADLDKLADSRGTSGAELGALAARTPAVVWINESVHGDESPGFETGMQTLYQLAASDEPAMVAALDSVIVVLNPSTNPDGHERFAVWYNSVGVHSPDPRSLEKQQPWSIAGRFNHYRFDMNRDVMTSTQREVRNLVRAHLRWHPMVAIDQHGQVTTYFFPPTANPLNPSLAGSGFEHWMEIFGRANAAAFDQYGWMYYSRDVFDLYGPFYWDSWPSLTGAIGMTYETDGGGHRGILYRRADGTILTFRGGIAKHFVSAMATVRTAAANRASRVRDYAAFRQAAVAEGRSQAMKRIVWTPGDDPQRAADLAATLLRSGIEVRRLTTPLAAHAHAYYDDAVSARRFDAGAYVVDLAQPQGRMARAFLDPAPPLDTAFARIQVEKFLRNQRRGANVPGEDYEFYDVSAWSLPVTFGVEAYWTDDAGAMSADLLTLPDSGTRVLGELLPVAIPSGVSGGRAASAYLFAPGRAGASVLAFHLMDRGYRVAVALKPIAAGGRSWPRGTYIVRTARNDSTLPEALDSLSRMDGVEVAAVNSAFNEGGQYGIGSEEVDELETPHIALVGGDGTAQTSYGAIWWSLEQRYHIPFTPIQSTSLGGNLSRFNVIIVPDASPGFLASRLGKSGADALRSWVRAGGTLVTMGGATEWAAMPDVNLTSARMYEADTAKPSAAADSVRKREEARDSLLAATSPTGSLDAPAPLPGSHLDVVLDRTHWLTHGYERPRLTAMVSGSTILKLSREGANVAVFPREGKLLRGGFAFPNNNERLLHNAALVIEEPLGDGHVVLFANDPMFRGWWRALDKLVLNAIVLGPGM